MNPYAVIALSLLLAAPASKEIGPAVSPQPVSSVEAMARAEGLVREAIEAYKGVRDYTSHFLKQERIGGRLRKEETIFLKFKKPFMVYMDWIDSPDKGMEAIYVEGKNDGKLIAHLGGFLSNFVPTAHLEIDSPLVTKNNRHLVTETGIGVFLERYQADFRKGKQRQELSIILHGEERVSGRMAHKVEARLPKKPDNGYYCYRSVVYFDVERKLPVKSEFYDHADTLIEKYTFLDLKLNVGLTDRDFDPKNENYRF